MLHTSLFTSSPNTVCWQALEGRSIVSLQAGYLDGALKDISDAIKVGGTLHYCYSLLTMYTLSTGPALNYCYSADHLLQLALVVLFIQPLAQIVHLHRLWLSPVATCAGGAFHSATSTDSSLAHVVVSPSATCAGGAFSSSHWRKHCTGTWATCTESCATVHTYMHMRPHVMIYVVCTVFTSTSLRSRTAVFLLLMPRCL